MFSPIFAAFYEMGTPPFYFYEFIRLDKEHLLDLGVESEVPDPVQKHFQSTAFSKGSISKASLVRICN